METFTGIIKKIDGKDASYIEMPFDIEKLYGNKRIKVKATFDGYEYRGSIVRMGAPCYILGITKKIRKAIGKTFGDEIVVTFEKDDEERMIEIPEDFQKRILEDEVINAFWKKLSFSMKKKYVSWIVSAKKEETRNSRLEQAIVKLSNNEKL